MIQSLHSRHPSGSEHAYTHAHVMLGSLGLMRLLRIHRSATEKYSTISFGGLGFGLWLVLGLELVQGLGLG